MPRSVRLKHPIQIKRLVLRPLTAGDFAGVDLHAPLTLDVLTVLVSRASGLPVDVLKRVDADDFARAIRAVVQELTDA